MKKIVITLLVFIGVSVLFVKCRYTKDICLKCTITIAGLEDDQPEFCGERDEVDDKEAEFQEIVDRENSIVGQTATLECDKYYE